MKKNYIGLRHHKEATDNPKKNSWLMSAFAAAALFLAGNSFAQTNIANYSFAKSTGATYTPITGGTKLFPTGTGATYDNEISAAIPLPSPFTYGGVPVTSVYISANGFVTFGAAPLAATYTPLSTTITGGTGAISAFGQDGGSSTVTGAVPEVRYQDIGTEFVIQYQDHANYFNVTQERLNFQIRLVYATGQINIVYGNCTNPGTSTSSITPQVGIRGNSTVFATNVSPLLIGNVPTGTTCDWSKAVTGNSEASTMLFAGSNVNVKIPTGLQYSWTPGTQLPVRTFTATTAVTNSGATVNWTAPAGATAYNVQYRVVGSCDWTSFSGNPVSATTAPLTGLLQNTTYQVQVQALNGTAQAMYSHIPNLAGTGSGYASAGSFTTAANCASVVTGLASSALTPNSATISWTASTSAPANGYEYYYSTSSTAPTSTTIPSGSVGAGVLTTNLSGLTPLTQYYYWVRGNCNGVDKGVWSSSANFTTLGLCPTVTAPASNATGVSVTPTITWTAINGVSGYRITVGTTSGGTNIVNNVDLGNVTSYTFQSSLNNATSYYYSVTGYTATNAAPATACTVRMFQTVCGATSVSYTLDFENVTTPALPICTSVINNGSGNLWKTATAPNSGFTGKVLNYSFNSSNAANTWFFTQGINLTSGVSYRIKYKYANSSGAAYAEKMKVAYGTSQTSAAMTTVLADYPNILTTGVATSAFVDFIPTATGVYYFGFQAYSAADMNQLYVDDINIDVTPTCFEPTAVSVSAVTTSDATVTWTAPSIAPANGYEIYYSTTNTAPTAATPATTTSTTTSKSLSSLSPATTYYVWVRSVCGATDKSLWSTSATFKTLCTSVAVPFTENFNTGALANCWSTYSTNNVGLALWQFGNAAQDYGTTYSATGQNNTAGQFAYVDASDPYTGTGVSDVTLASPAVNLTGLSVPTLEFRWFKNHGTAVNPTSPPAYDNNKLTVAVKDVTSSTWETLFTSTANAPTWRTETITLPTSYVGKTVQVRFVVDKNVAGNGYFYDNVLLDDVSLKEAVNLATTEINSNKAGIKAYPNPFTDLLTISDIKDVKSIMISDMSGKIVRTIAKPESTLRLGDLNAGMYLVILTMNDGSRQTIKAIKK